MANISIRHSIRWLPIDDEASEATSTIVLTSPERRFVDLRIFKADLNSNLSTTTTESSLSTSQNSHHLLPLSALDWAIAGTSAETPIGDDDTVTRGKWTHWIDSRVRDIDTKAESVVDEGVMCPNPDVAVGGTLEKGRMVNPSLGNGQEEMDYEEVWVPEEVLGVPGFPSLGDSFGGDGDDDEGGKEGEAKGKKCCVVLELDTSMSSGGKGGRRRGMVVRLGQYCQALLRTGEREGDITVERLKWNGEAERWDKVVRIGGEAEVPTDFATYFGHEATVGDKVRVGEDVWIVVEAGGL